MFTALFSSATKRTGRHLKRRVFLSTVNSILAGMVAVAGGAVAYNPWSAVVIGCIAALSFLLWSKLFTRFEIDDPVETAAGKLPTNAPIGDRMCARHLVHIGGGLWGIFAVPIFRRTLGPDVNGEFDHQLFTSIVYRIGSNESWRVRLRCAMAADGERCLLSASGPTELVVRSGCGHRMDKYPRCSSLPVCQARQTAESVQRRRTTRFDRSTRSTCRQRVESSRHRSVSTW
jgi:hypothetical protein